MNPGEENAGTEFITIRLSLGTMDVPRRVFEYKPSKLSSCLIMAIFFFTFIVICLLYGNHHEIHEGSDNQWKYPPNKIGNPATDLNNLNGDADEGKTLEPTKKDFNNWINFLDPRRFMAEHKSVLKEIQNNDYEMDTDEPITEYDPVYNDTEYYSMEDRPYNETDYDAE